MTQIFTVCFISKYIIYDLDRLLNTPERLSLSHTVVFQIASVILLLSPFARVEIFLDILEWSIISARCDSSTANIALAGVKKAT